MHVGSAAAVAGSRLLLLAVVRQAMKRDLQSTMFSSVLLLKQAFEQAESNNGLTLTTNLAATEDIGLLEAVEQWDRSVHGSSGSAPPLSARASVVRASPSRTLRPVGMTQDPRLIADLQGARDDNASLQERFQRMQVQTQQILREKSELQAQVEAMSAVSSDETEALRAQVDQLQAELQAAYDREAAAPPPEQSSSGHDTLLRELHDAQDATAQLQASLDQAQAELDSRLERSTQFVNLKQVRCDTTAAAPPSRRHRANAARLSRMAHSYPHTPPRGRCYGRRVTWCATCARPSSNMASASMTSTPWTTKRARLEGRRGALWQHVSRAICRRQPSLRLARARVLPAPRAGDCRARTTTLFSWPRCMR